MSKKVVFRSKQRVVWHSGLDPSLRASLVERYGPGPFVTRFVNDAPKYMRPQMQSRQWMYLGDSQEPHILVSGALLEHAVTRH